MSPFLDREGFARSQQHESFAIKKRSIPGVVPVAPVSKPPPTPEILRRVLDGLRRLPC